MSTSLPNSRDRCAIRSLGCGLVALLALSLRPTPALGQYEITWWSIDGGGQMFSSGGGFDLGATIGQHDAGSMSGAGGYAIEGGFWAVTAVSAAPCPGDIDDNGVIGLPDLTLFLSSFGACAGDANFIPDADLNASGCVSLRDLTEFLSLFGSTCP